MAKKFSEYMVDNQKFSTFGEYLNGIVESYQKLEDVMSEAYYVKVGTDGTVYFLNAEKGADLTKIEGQAKAIAKDDAGQDKIAPYLSSTVKKARQKPGIWVMHHAGQLLGQGTISGKKMMTPAKIN